MTEKRTFDGSGNNREHNDWGRGGTALLRFTKADYYGGGSIPSGQNRPNPRHISNIVCQDTDGEAIPNRNRLSHFVWAWGQFLDHEIDLSPEGDEHANFDIPDVPGAEIEFRRSRFDPSTGTSLRNPRQQVNALSAYVDASNVYGADETRATALRSLDGTGRLKVSPKAGKEPRDLLPLNVGGLPNASMTDRESAYVAGDIRVNEHVVLTCMHTLFVREHNLLCSELASATGIYKEFARTLPKKTGRSCLVRDELIFQRARRIVGAMMQVITYEEFLPALLGRNALQPYAGYNSRVDASVCNIFSTACYRLGHSMLPPTIPLVDGRGRESCRLDFGELFFCPELITQHGIDVFLRGLFSERMQEIDNLTVEPIRSALFTNKTNALNDLAALNIQRGRDHGLPGYNQCRADFNLAVRTSFSEVSSNENTQMRLASAYGGKIDRVDPWIGAISEDHVWHRDGVPVNGRMKGATQAAVGELVFVVLKDQFERLRDGDRFWYENDPEFDAADIRRLKKTTLARVLERNSGVSNVPRNVFKAEK